MQITEAHAEAAAKAALKTSMIVSILNIHDGMVDANATLANVSGQAALTQALLTSLGSSVDATRNALTAKRVEAAQLAAAYRKLQARAGVRADLSVGATDLDAAALEGKRHMVAAEEARRQANSQAEADDIEELLGNWHADLPTPAPSPAASAGAPPPVAASPPVAAPSPVAEPSAAAAAAA